MSFIIKILKLITDLTITFIIFTIIIFEKLHDILRSYFNISSESKSEKIIMLSD